MLWNVQKVSSFGLKDDLRGCSMKSRAGHGAEGRELSMSSSGQLEAMLNQSCGAEMVTDSTCALVVIIDVAVVAQSNPPWAPQCGCIGLLGGPPIGFLNGSFLNGLPSSIRTKLDSMASQIGSYNRLLNDSSQCSSSISTRPDSSMESSMRAREHEIPADLLLCGISMARATILSPKPDDFNHILLLKPTNLCDKATNFIKILMLKPKICSVALNVPNRLVIYMALRLYIPYK